jgi:hypothetical protein
MSKKLNPDRELVIQKYVVENKSIKQVAFELGLGKTTLSRYLKRYNIKKRDRYELHKKIFAGEGNPFYGKKHMKETRDAISKTMIDNGTTKGKNNPAFKYDISKEFLLEEYIKDNKMPSKIAKKVGCRHCTILRALKKYNIPLRPQNIEKKELFKGEKNPNWKNGLSYLPYTPEFNQALKDKIRKRDNYTCQNCFMSEEEHNIVFGTNLHTHHIDYIKEHCNENNLITLCNGCNTRANYNRPYWQEFFTNKIGQMKHDAI